MSDLETALRDLQHGSIPDACLRLARLRDPKAIQPLVRAFSHQTDAQLDSDSILHALTELAATDALRLLSQDLTLPASRRFAAFSCLCRLPDPQSLPLLRQALLHPHPLTRRLAILTLGSWQAFEAVPDLLALAQRHLRTPLRRDIFSSLALLPCAASFHFFQTLFLSADPDLCKDLLSSLASAPPDPDLLELLHGLQSHFPPDSPLFHDFSLTLSSLLSSAQQASSSRLQAAAIADEAALFR